MTNSLGEVKKITFAVTEKEAIEKFEKYAKADPLPDVAPALLNSADIYDYAAITGMVFPFHWERAKEKLKSASYEVDLLGKIIYWDGDGKKVTKDIFPGDKFVLKRNSIAFVTPEPTFHLPDYIAVRFNLKITHVHRGILLGTGPLVDPGYVGKLLIPLHNLTNNDYVFKGGEGFIWMEFTKISSRVDWLKVHEIYERSGTYFSFPAAKKELEPEALITKALRNQDASIIQSAIPIVAEEARVSIKEATEMAKRGRTINLALIISLIGIVASILTSVYLGNRQFMSMGLQNQAQIEQLKLEVRDLKVSITELRNSLTEAKSGTKTNSSKLPNEKKHQ